MLERKVEDNNPIFAIYLALQWGMVDLSLASSYIPVFICLIKSMIVCFSTTGLLYYGGICALVVVLLFDRLFFNSEFIVDVNAVLGAVAWSLVSTHERHHRGFYDSSIFVFVIVVNLAWVMIGTVQICKPLIFKNKNEHFFYGFFALALSFTHCSHEHLLHQVIRILMYNFSIFLQVYWQISTFQEEQLSANLMRNAIILVGYQPISAGACFLYFVLVLSRWKPSTGQIIVEIDTEAAALREALAMRKEKSSN